MKYDTPTTPKMNFDTKEIHLSDLDLTRGLRFPEKLSPELAELIGIHMGDGSMNNYSRYDYRLYYCGNLKKDREYMEYVGNLLQQLFGINPKIAIDKKRNALALIIRSKSLFLFYVHCMKILPGKKNYLSIPVAIRENEELLKSFLRGMFDTDGCVTFQRDRTYVYLLIKICTKHKSFAEEISNSLEFLGIHCFITIKHYSVFTGYDVVVRNKNVKTFFSVIGSRNPRNITRMKQLSGVSGDAGI